MLPEEALLQKALASLLDGFGKNHARVYWALINNMGKNVAQLEKETLLAHTTIYVILAFLIKHRLVRETNTRPKFYYCRPTLEAVKILLKERKSQFNTELSDTYRDIKKIVQNATSQSGEKYLIEINGGQTTLYNHQTREPITWKHEIDQIKQKIDKMPAKSREKAWQIGKN